MDIAYLPTILYLGFIEFWYGPAAADTARHFIFGSLGRPPGA